ncbi:hypothetical protein GNY06_04765 [Elizabethkingia argentiflava]|uniref:Knr4/Smi1-like domain-containing protein n=1 Tax=Elizabethkingia argenteiflava TaxID=2681556 RepID=A0A845PSU6_9FLAO|nr:SMI1/KNR4 family protein [Elizabethkingia argenteiflava]NAW50725.1 hypothetical protein [Elizabethkingia argenteiflava]
MSYKNEILRLGGMRELFPGHSTKLESEDISKIETMINGKIPQDVKDFLLTYGICNFHDEVEFKPYSTTAEYVHSTESQQPNFSFNGSMLGVFFGRDSEKGKSYDIFENINLYKERIPNKFIPFGNDGMGNLILISTNDSDYGKVYFWDHEAEWDIEDYEDETGLSMTEDVKYQNLWLIGINFDDFFSRLEILSID